MEIQQNAPLKGKTTMRIGGDAGWYVEVKTKKEVEAAAAFAIQKSIPLLVLGGGSNTIFEDGTINALVVRINAVSVTHNAEVQQYSNATIVVESGKNLPELIFELAEIGLDLSPLTGILGTVGGAIFGNAGQGPKGIWIDAYIESVTALVNGAWRTLTKEECHFRYRESWFKEQSSIFNLQSSISPIIWSATLNIPRGDSTEIKAEIERLLKKRIETQPHVKTAGSCFKALGETPAWKLIDEAGLRGKTIGGVCLSEKHCNFLINNGSATYRDTVDIVEAAKEVVESKAENPHARLEVEMRFIQSDGSVKEW